MLAFYSDDFVPSLPESHRFQMARYRLLGACMAHNPGFNFNDDNVVVGAACWTRLAAVQRKEHSEQRFGPERA
ncbi:MAG: hypothetical protein ACREWJ_14585 [Rhodoferax sp.]